MMMRETDTEKPLRDQVARDVVTHALERNVMVLAGAGAGKTHALIERMVAGIRAGVTEVDRMAAITFTRKAAGEMRGRFFVRLREEAVVAGTPAEVERIRAALRQIDQCFIGTIHSFCGRLLRERPIEAGLPPDFAEMDDREDAELRRRAWDGFVQERYAADDERLDELEDHGICPEDLYAFFGRRCEYADLAVKPTSTQRPDLRPYVDEVRSFLNRVAPCIPSLPEKRDGLMTTVRRARHFIDNHGIETDYDAARLLGMFEGSVGVTLKHWEDGNAARTIRDELLPALQDEVIEPVLRAWRESAYRLVTEFVDDAMRAYDVLRREEGKLTFQDLLLRTACLLRNAPHVRSYFQSRYRTLLVDEFQDTDPIQAEILFYLTGTDVAERRWRRLVPRPGSLFLVGDDKQSIYRFRRADVAVFRFVAERIEETGGEVVHLNTSFRTLGTLCRWISEAFPAVFAADGEPYQADFQPLYEYRPPGIDPHCVRKISIEKVPRNRTAEIAAADAERIAGFIAEAIGKRAARHDGYPMGNLEASAGDFLVLTRTTSCLPVYARALEERGIPFDVVGGGRLGESREVEALTVLLETIYRPEDPVPFLAFLRGPLAGLSDAELYEYTRAGGRLRVGEPVPDGISDELRERVTAAHDLLEGVLEDVTSLPAGAALERILERTGYLAFSAVHPEGGGSSRAGSLVRLLSLVRRWQVRGWSWGRMVEELRQLVDDRGYRVEQMTLETGRDDVVRLMNVHQAKGLEAPVVFLANPYDTSYERDPGCHVSRSGDASYLSMTVTKPKGDYGYEIVAQPEGWEADLDEERRHAAAEEVRLLYVAATRARDLLVVSTYPAKSGRGPWAPLYRYLDEVPELPNPPVRTVEVEASSELSYDSLCARGTRRLERSRRPSYVVETVSGRSADEEFAYYSREGRGPAYGVVVHRLFEEAVRRVLPAARRPYVAELVRAAGLPDERADDAMQALKRFETSALWDRIEGAVEVYTEVPIATPLSRDGREGARRGVIDLVFRDSEGWNIVDYKTDVAETPSEADALRRRYRGQLAEYESYWSSITGTPVSSAEPWLVHGPVEERQLNLF